MFRWSMPRGTQIGRRADEFRIGGDREDPPHALQVLGRHVLKTLDQPPRLQMLADLLLRQRRQLFNLGLDHASRSKV